MRAVVLVGVFLLDVVLELVAAVLAVGAVGALVLRVAAALQRDVAHEVAARVVAALAVRALVALHLVSLAREVGAGLLRREYVVLGGGLLVVRVRVVVVVGRGRRQLGVLLELVRARLRRRHVLHVL